jgi:hypothetical protein
MNGNFSMHAMEIATTGSNIDDMRMMNRQTPCNFPAPDDQSPSEFNPPPPVINLAGIWFTKLRGSEEHMSHSPPSPTATTPTDPQLDPVEITGIW